jgi:hypothetical protein
VGLTITLGHLDHFEANLHLLTPSLLFSTFAPFTYGERDLVVRASVILGATEYVPSHQQNSGIVIDRGAGVPTKFGHRFAEGRERFSGHIEPQDMSSSAWIDRVLRHISRPVTGDQLLHFPNCPTVRRLEPLTFGSRRGHARQLARRGPAQFSARQLVAKDRKFFESLGNPEAFEREARRVAE